jgi:hypothetical protein
MFTIAYKLLKPSTLVGEFVNRCPKVSDILCAGSVDNKSTDTRTLVNCMAKLQLKLLFKN